MSRRNSHQGKGFAMGIFLGSVIGGVTALLFAPKSGEKMRKDIEIKYNKASDKAQCLMEDICDQTKDLVERAKDIAEDARAVVSRKMKK